MMRRFCIAAVALFLAGIAIAEISPRMMQRKAVSGVQVAATPSTPPPDELLWWDFNDGYPAIQPLDYSGNNHPVDWSLALLGPGRFLTAPYTKYGSLLYHTGDSDTNGSLQTFAGPNHRLVVTNSSLGFSGTSDYSLSIWVKPGTQTDSYPEIMSVSAGSGAANTCFGIAGYSGTWQLLDYGVSWNDSGVAFGTAWKNFILVVTNSGKTASLFIDGALKKQVTNNSHSQTNSKMYIAGGPLAGGVVGVWSDFRAWPSYALTAADIITITNGGDIAATKDVWVKFPTNMASPYSITNLTPYVPFGPPWQSVLYQTTPYTAFPTLTGGVATVNGSQYAGTNCNLLVTNQMSLSIWACPSTVGTKAAHVAIGSEDINTGGEAWFLSLGGSIAGFTNCIRLGSNAAGSPGATTSNGTWNATDIGTWHHILATASNSTVHIYKDGVDLPLSANTYVQSGTNTWVTCGIDGDDRSSNGYIGSLDNMRLWGRVLTAAEVAYLYSQGHTESSRNYVAP